MCKCESICLELVFRGLKIRQDSYFNVLFVKSETNDTY